MKFVNYLKPVLYYNLYCFVEPHLVPCWILPEVLNVVLNTQQRQGVADRTHVRHCLLGWTPVHICKENPGLKNRQLYRASSQAHFQTSSHGSPGFLTVT